MIDRIIFNLTNHLGLQNRKSFIIWDDHIANNERLPMITSDIGSVPKRLEYFITESRGLSRENVYLEVNPAMGLIILISNGAANKPSLGTSSPNSLK